MQDTIVLPSGAFYGKNKKAIIESLFRPGGTASGTFKRLKNGIMFKNMQGRPVFFLVDNAYNEQFFVSCGYHEETGKTYYMHGLCSVTEKHIFGTETGYKAQREIAERIAKENPETN